MAHFFVLALVRITLDLFARIYSLVLLLLSIRQKQCVNQMPYKT